jgi:TolB-like protein/Flp pilus assembly protein TadD
MVVGLLMLVILAFIAVSHFSGPKKNTFAGLKTIALLPFKNQTGNPDNEYISDGMTEDILDQLSKISAVNVISFKTMTQYKGTNKKPGDIGKELNAGIIFEGSIDRSGDRLRITAQLIDAGDDSQLWSETFTCGMNDIVDVENKITERLAGVLDVKLTPVEKHRIEKKSTANPEAYDYYLKGRDYYSLYNKSGNENAIGFYKKAMELDSSFALAYAGLGDAYNKRYLEFGFPQAWVDSAIAMCHRAIALDPNLAEGYKALGAVYYAMGWYKKALEEDAKAVELAPIYSDAVNNFGVVLAMKGDVAEGLRWIKKGILFDPTQARGYMTCGEIYYDLVLDSAAQVSYTKALQLQPENSDVYIDLIWMHLAEHDAQKARVDSREGLKINPKDPTLLLAAGFVELMSGNLQRAEEYFKLNAAADPLGEGVPALSYTYLRTGKKAEAAKIFRSAPAPLLKELKAGNESFLLPYNLAVLNAVQKNTGEGLNWFEKAITAGWIDYRWIEIDPLLDNLRHEQRFQKITGMIKAEVEEQRKRSALPGM